MCCCYVSVLNRPMKMMVLRSKPVSTGSTGFGMPRPLSSALATLGMLQPRALGVLNPVDPWTRCLTSIYGDVVTGDLSIIRDS